MPGLRRMACVLGLAASLAWGGLATCGAAETPRPAPGPGAAPSPSPSSTARPPAVPAPGRAAPSKAVAQPSTGGAPQAPPAPSASPAPAPSPWPALAPSASPSPPPGSAPVLTLEKAIETSLTGNRTVQNARYEVVKTRKTALAATSHRYPILQVDLKSGMLLSPVGVSFNQGAFGIYPGVGPIPDKNVTIETQEKVTTYFVLAVRQPVTQLPRINLNIKVREIDNALAAEELRLQRETVVTDVKRSYSAIVQTEAAVRTAQDNVRFYRELERTVADRYAQQTVLKTELLDVRKHLAQAEYELRLQQDALANNKAQLNVLLGRDVHTPFEVTDVPQSPVSQMALPDLEQKALVQRPQIRQATMRILQAKLEKRIKASEYSPDLNLALTYMQPYNVTLSQNKIITVGAEMTWQPVTWGKTANEVAAKAQSVLQTTNTQKQVSDQVLVEVGSQYRQLHACQQKVGVAKLGVDATREDLRVTRLRYEQRVALLQDVYEAQHRFTNATMTYLEALLSVQIAEAELEQAIGED